MSANQAQIDPFAFTFVRLLRGVVTENKDPKKMGRVRVRIFGIHGTKEAGIKDNELPWALPIFLGASYNSGTFIPPEVESVVAVLFENGDKEAPVYLGGMYSSGRTKKVTFKMDEGLEREDDPKIKETPRDIRNLDTRVLYRSPKGHRIIFRDDDEKECFVLADHIGQSFFMEGRLNPKQFKALEKLDDKDTGVEGAQPDSSGNTPVDDQKLALCKENPQIGLRALCGSTLKFTSDKTQVENKTELFSEGDEKATVKMTSGKVESTIETVAGQKTDKFKVIHNKDKYEIQGPKTTFTMTKDGKIDIKGYDITISGSTLTVNAPIAKHNSVAWTLLTGKYFLIDCCPMPYSPTPNVVQGPQQKYASLNVKEPPLDTLDNSAAASAAASCGGCSGGCSGASECSTSKDSASSLSSACSGISSSRRARLTASELDVLISEGLYEVQELCSAVQTAADSILEYEPQMEKVDKVIEFARTVPGKDASYLKTQSDNEQLIDSLKSCALNASEGIRSQLETLISQLETSTEKADLVDSLKNIDHLAEFQDMYKGLLETLQSSNKAVKTRLDALKEKLSGTLPSGYVSVASQILALSYEYPDLTDKINALATNVDICNGAYQSYVSSPGKVLSDLYKWGDQSPILKGILDQAFDGVLGSVIRDHQSYNQLETQLEFIENETVKESLQNILDSFNTTSEYWNLAGQIINGKPISDALYEDDQAKGQLSEDFRSIVLGLLTIDIVGRIQQELKDNYRTSAPVTELLKVLGWQATTE